MRAYQLDHQRRPRGIEQRAAEAKQRAAASARRLAEKPRRRPADVELSAEDEKLLADLYALRKRLASKQKIPAYLVFSDATLREMVQKSRSAPTSCSTSPAWARRKPPATARSSSPPSRRPSAAAKNKTFRFPQFLHRMWKTERFL